MRAKRSPFSRIRRANFGNRRFTITVDQGLCATGLFNQSLQTGQRRRISFSARLGRQMELAAAWRSGRGHFDHFSVLAPLPEQLGMSKNLLDILSESFMYRSI